MNWGGPEFVIAIIALSTFGWVVNNWIRAKHGYPLENEWFGMSDKSDSPDTTRLKHENEQLRDRLEASEDRLAVLERIVTDRGYYLADEIEALRDTSPARNGAKAGERG